MLSTSNGLLWKVLNLLTLSLQAGFIRSRSIILNGISSSWFEKWRAAFISLFGKEMFS